MVRLQDMMDNSTELLDSESQKFFDKELCEILDDELRELQAYIADELRRREKEREDQARKKVMEAIQNFLAAGYSLWVEGEVKCESNGWKDYRPVRGEVESIEIEDDEVTLNFIEQQ